MSPVFVRKPAPVSPARQKTQPSVYCRKSRVFGDVLMGEESLPRRNSPPPAGDVRMGNKGRISTPVHTSVCEGKPCISAPGPPAGLQAAGPVDASRRNSLPPLSAAATVQAPPPVLCVQSRRAFAVTGHPALSGVCVTRAVATSGRVSTPVHTSVYEG